MAKHRLPAKIVDLLEEAIEAAELKNASFDGVADTAGTVITVRRANGHEDVYRGGSVTDFIRSQTRLYRNSWVIPRIREVLDWSKGKDDGSMLEFELLRRVKEGSWPHPENLDDLVAEVERLRQRNGELEVFKRKVEEGLHRLLDE